MTRGAANKCLDKLLPKSKSLPCSRCRNRQRAQTLDSVQNETNKPTKTKHNQNMHVYQRTRWKDDWLLRNPFQAKFEAMPARARCRGPTGRKVKKRGSGAKGGRQVLPGSPTGQVWRWPRRAAGFECNNLESQRGE